MINLGYWHNDQNVTHFLQWNVLFVQISPAVLSHKMARLEFHSSPRAIEALKVMLSRSKVI